MKIIDLGKRRFENKEERIFVSSVVDKVEDCYYTKTNTFTDFLDPSKLSTCMQILKHNTYIDCHVYGGYNDSERMIIGFYNKEDVITNKDFNIKTIEILYNTKFVKTLSHRDYLGSVIGLGLKREKLGDIIVKDNGAFLFVKEDISEFIIHNLTKVRNASVKCNFADEIDLPVADITDRKITVSSLRLDVLISEGFNISRKKASDFIKSEKVFIDWVTEINGAKTVDEGATITLRGKGRIKFNEIVGKSRKGKIIIEIS